MQSFVHYTFIWCLICAGHLSEASPEGQEGTDCLSYSGSGWCETIQDEPVSAVQVMLQHIDRGKRRRLGTQVADASGSDESTTSFVQQESTPVSKPHAAKGHQSAVHKAEVQRNDASTDHPDGGEPQHSELSFFQQAAEVFEGRNRATPKGSQEDVPGNLEENVQAFSSVKEFQSETTNRIAMCALAFLAIVYVLIRCGDRRRFVPQFMRREKKGIESLPAKLQGSEAPPTFNNPKLPNAAASFAVPLAARTDFRSDVVTFDIPEASGSVFLRAVLSRLPSSSSWAKVEIFASGTDSTPGVSTPLASCSLAGSDAEIESLNVKGALQSWLSLLLHEKSTYFDPNQENEEVQLTTPDAEHASIDRIQEPAKCEKGLDQQGPRPLPRLEVKDGLGSCLGMLEPTTDGHYGLWQYGQLALEIESHLQDHWIALSKDGKDRALATGLLHNASPECTGEEEFLQVDVISHAKSQETVLMLMCVLAMIALKEQSFAAVSPMTI